MQKLTSWIIVFASLSINLPTSFMSAASALIMVFWVLSGNFKKKFQYINNNPAALSAIALFLLYAIGMLYSSGPWEDRIASLLKYHKLLFIPIIISILHSDKYRSYAINAFLISLVAILIISYLKWLGIVPHHDTIPSQGYFVFKGRIAHSIFMSFGMYLMMSRAFKSDGLIRWMWITLSLLAIFNVLFLVNGRTGQVIMLALIVWFAFESWGVKSLKYAFGIILLGAGLLQTASDFSNSRLLSVTQEIARHQPEGQHTSAGERVDMYKNTFDLIKQNPIFGRGTGSIKSEFHTLYENKKTSLSVVSNPHNQFLFTTQELGIIGFGILILFWHIQWRQSYCLSPYHNGYALRGLVVTIVVGSLFNSLIFDAGEGKFYCILAGVLLSAYPSKEQCGNQDQFA